jgi:hypothetical protein
LVGFLVMFGMLYGIGINKPRGLSVKTWCYGYLTISIAFDTLVIIALAGTPQFTWLTNLLLGLSAGAATGLALHVTHHITEEDQHNQEEPNKHMDLK